MRRFMRKAEGLAVAALALIGAGQVVVWMNQAVQYALVAYGQWETAEAAKAAPLILFSLAFGLALSLYGMEPPDGYYFMTDAQMAEAAELEAENEKWEDEADDE